MRKCPKNVQPGFLFLSKTCSTGAFLLIAVPLLVFRPISAKAQSGAASPAQSQASSQGQSQKNPQKSSRKDSQPESQSVTAAPKDSGNSQSLADAARANAKKAKPKPKHVFTNDDLSGLGGTISVVGNGSSEGEGRSVNASSGANSASSAGQNEAVWREKARAINDQIAAVDQQIDRVKQEIAKSGPAAFDPTTGLQQNVIIVHDRNAELQQLQDRKQNLEKQLEDLTDEGRKAGADPGWFR